MRLSEIDFETGTAVQGYGPGFFRIGGEIYEGAMAVMPKGIRSWGGFEDLEFRDIDVLLVGTGAELRPLPRAFRETLEARGIGADPMATPTACRSYNILLAEARRVGLAVLPV